MSLLLITKGTQSLGIAVDIESTRSHRRDVIPDEVLAGEEHGFVTEGTASLLLLVQPEAGGLESSARDRTCGSLVIRTAPSGSHMDGAGLQVWAAWRRTGTTRSLWHIR